MFVAKCIEVDFASSGSCVEVVGGFREFGRDILCVCDGQDDLEPHGSWHSCAEPMVPPPLSGDYRWAPG